MSDSTSFSVSTINLNGIRAAEKRGFLDWIDDRQPDVLLLQEVRAPEDITAAILGDQWQVASYPCEIKGRAGVSIAVRRDVGELLGRRGLAPTEQPVDSGRWIEADLDMGFPLTVVSTYFHSGQIGTDKQVAKMAHLPLIGARLQTLLAESVEGRQALVAGDFNIVRSAADIKNWKPNHNKTAGVLDEEIEYLDLWLGQGWRDVVRDLAGDVQGPYSWWSWRGKAFDNNAGWRIDYQFATPQLAERAETFDILRAPSWESRFSDHAPVTVQFRR